MAGNEYNEYSINGAIDFFIDSPKALAYLCTEYDTNSLDCFRQSHIDRAHELRLLDTIKGTRRKRDDYEKIEKGDTLLYVRKQYASLITKSPTNNHHHFEHLAYADFAINRRDNTMIKCRDSLEKLVDRALFIG